MIEQTLVGNSLWQCCWQWQFQQYYKGNTDISAGLDPLLAQNSTQEEKILFQNQSNFQSP